MQKSVRQSMAWLHSWVGLLLGWLMFCIFLTGTTTYYREEINLWSQPTLATIQVDQKNSILQAFQYLDEHAKDAKSWFIQVANDESPVNKMYWQKPDGTYDSANTNPNTGEKITLPSTPIGEFFYNFHFQLHAIPYWLGRLIVSFAAFMMLITLISGIITHKKIFTDFFTLRTFKGQRSYLDFHNVSGVIALPFFLTVTFTGLAIFFYLYFPLGINQVYPKNTFQYFEEINTVNLPSHHNNKADSKPILDIADIQKIVSKHMGNIQYSNITVKNPNTASTLLTFTALNDHSITRDAAQISLTAQGEIQPSTKNYSPVATLNSGVYGLHMAKFAQPLLRLGLYFSGILGCCMIASGLLLWSLKRQLQHQISRFHFGFYLVDRLNITAILGLPIAMMACFIANRSFLILNHQNFDISLFFSVWLFCFILSLCIKKHYLWTLFLKIFIILGCFLIIVDFLYLSVFLNLEQALSYWKFIRFDCFVLGFVLLAIFIHQKIEPIKLKVTKKMKSKLNHQTPPQHGSM